MAKKDYYSVLGISRNAAPEEIKAAYKKLAKQYHPDLHKGDKEKENKFKEINEAYKVLSDDKARDNYNRFGTADSSASSFDSSEFGFESFDFSDFNDIFSSFFGSDFRQGSGFRASRRRTARGNDLRYNLDITLEETAFGVVKDIVITKMDVCEKCNGSGAKYSSDIVQCPSCNGSGYIQQSRRMPFGVFSTTAPCHKCGGTGRYIRNPCSVCDGEGRIRKTKKLEVKIPAGIETGNSLRIIGEGEAGEHGADAGNLYVVINIKKHPVFERKEDDIYCEIPISFVQAALGSEIEVPTLKGKAKLKIPEGTQTNTIFRMKDKGIPHLGRPGTGSENVRIIVQVPEKLSAKQKEILEEFAKAGGDKVRPFKKGFFEKLRDL